MTTCSRASPHLTAVSPYLVIACHIGAYPDLEHSGAGAKEISGQPRLLAEKAGLELLHTQGAERKAAASQKSPYAVGALIISILVLGLSLKLLHLLQHLFEAVEWTVRNAISIIALIHCAQRYIELRSLSELNRGISL